jgi:hypothetical protein
VKLDTTNERASRSARIVPRPSANQLASHTREKLSPILRKNAAASATRNQEPARDDPHAEIEEGPERADAIGSAGLKHRDRQGRQADDGDPVAPVERNFAGQIEGVDEESRQRDENELHPADHADEQHRRVAWLHRDLGHAFGDGHGAPTARRRSGRSFGEAGGRRLKKLACVECAHDGNSARSRQGRRDASRRAKRRRPGLGSKAETSGQVSRNL